MRIIFVDPSTQLDTVKDLQARARGGMVSSLFAVSDYLAMQGHDVTVLATIRNEGVTRCGVKWFHEVRGEYDALITNRGTEDGYPFIAARKRFLWTHDLPHSGWIPEPKTIKAFACTVFMSRYAQNVWRAFYRDMGASALIPNGIDTRYFYPREKDFNYLIYASAPNRGLNKLPLILDALKTRTGKPLRMKAFSKLSVLHPNEGADTFDYKSIEESAVELCDPLPQSQFAEELGKASLMILPSGYPEICSNVVLQALASGTPIVTTGNLGATPEWVNSRNGRLTHHQPHDYMVHTVEIVRHAVSILEDERLHQRLIRGAQNTRIHTWQEIGRQWERLLSRYC